jgi:hypothetical protein
MAKLLKGRHGRRLARVTRSMGMNSLFDEWVDPRLSFSIVKVISAGNGSVLLQGNKNLKSSMLARVMRDCTQAVCFIATIGPALDKAIARANAKRNLTAAYLIERIGSAAIEDVVDEFQLLMKKRFQKEHADVTLRFSPGYCDWPLTEQKKVFTIVDPARIGVSLSSSCLMTPKKTVSGIFGIVPEGNIPYNPCMSCKKKDCSARRLRLRKL